MRFYIYPLTLSARLMETLLPIYNPPYCWPRAGDLTFFHFSASGSSVLRPTLQNWLPLIKCPVTLILQLKNAC